MHGNRGAFLCNSCNISFHTKEEAIVHVDEVHACGYSEKTTVFACEECGFSSPNQPEVLAHVNEHIDREESAPDLLYKCSVCGLEAGHRSVLEEHMISHVPSEVGSQHLVITDKLDVEEVPVTKSVYNCLLCKFSTSEAQVMSNHVRNHADKGPAKQTAVHGKLTPLKVQIPENPNFVYDPSLAVFRCKICGYTCEHQRTIKSHIWKHSGHQDISYPVFQPGKLDKKIPTSEMKVQITPKGFVLDPVSAHNENSNSEVPFGVVGASQKAVATENKLFSQSNVNLVEVEVESGQQPGGDNPPNPACNESLSGVLTTGEVVVSPTNSDKAYRTKETNKKRIVHFDISKENKPKKFKVEETDKPNLKSRKITTNVGIRTRAMQQAKEDVALENGLEILADSLIATAENEGDKHGSPPASDFVNRDITDVQDLLNMQHLIARKSNRKARGRMKRKEVISEVGANINKSGICSSLLAVIEQLRERSKSEVDDVTILSLKDKQPILKPPRVKRPKPPRYQPIDDGIPIDKYSNVELFEENGVSLYRCTLCHYKSVSTQQLKQHMRLHKSKQPFECSLCDYVAVSSENLQEHMLMHCKIRTYQCKLCPSSFSYKSQLRAHMRAHNEAEPFSCDLCDYETPKFEFWQAHVKMHAERKDVMCRQCQSLFKNDCHTAGHDQFDFKYGPETIIDEDIELILDSDDSQTEGNTKTYKCEVCSFACNSLPGIRSHCRLHIESQLMKCYHCEFVAASMRSLKSHMKRHVNDQRYVQQPLEQYKCKLCGYVCHHLPSLKSHMWRHASQENYSYKQANDVINAAIDYSGSDKKGSASTTAGKQADTLCQTENIPEKFIDRPNTDIANVVAFRCCQCGFESRDRVGLAAHMHIHMDIITKTCAETIEK